MKEQDVDPLAVASLAFLPVDKIDGAFGDPDPDLPT